MPKYIGVRYQQSAGRSGRPLVSFVAHAEEIKTWSGVPHKTSDFVGGFQRPLGDRYHKIVEFFDADGNSSPTAIVVAFRPKDVTITPMPRPSNWEPTGAVEPELVLIDIPDAPIAETLEQLAAQVCAKLGPRVRSDLRSPKDEEPSPEAEIDPANATQEEATEADVIVTKRMIGESTSAKVPLSILWGKSRPRRHWRSLREKLLPA